MQSSSQRSPVRQPRSIPKRVALFPGFGGLIVGRNVELISNQRIVQAWRPTHWEPGVSRIASFALKPQDSETRVTPDHTGFPEGGFDSLNTGWKPTYQELPWKCLA